MAKSLAASKKMMRAYLAELLTEDVAEGESGALVEQKVAPQAQVATETKVKEQQLEKLLQGVSPKLNIADVNSTITSAKSQARIQAEQLATQEPLLQTEISKDTGKHRYQENSFQALFFDIAGLLVAVPLIELGGIYNLAKITPLLGKPEWFEGVMLHRDDKINIVDTARWVMPEKYDKKLQDSLNYQYVIMLNNSNWGLMAEKLVDTAILYPEDVKWLATNSKRPWLAGLVKNKMCALLDVEALIQRLDDGMNVNES